jgi:hypothetical protein
MSTPAWEEQSVSQPSQIIAPELNPPVNLARQNKVVALKTLGRGVTVFSMLIVIALLIQAGGFISLYLHKQEEPEAAASFMLADPSATVAVAERDHGVSGVLVWLYPLAKFLGFVGSGMLVITLMLAAILSVSAAGRGTSILIGAFFWGIVILALASPWQELLRGALLHGSLYNLQDLIDWLRSIRPSNGESVSTAKMVHFFIRFMGLPLATFITVVFVKARFHAGCKALG